MGPSFALSAWFFTRALAVIYFVAFVSLAVQVRGLYGERGILPIKTYLQAVEAKAQPSLYWQVPSIFWVNSTDAWLVGATLVGAAAAVLALFGFAQGWMLLLCFGLYLSFVSTGQDFMSFQWDSLLLEVGFLALFAVPWAMRFDLFTAYEPHRLVRFTFYLVLFKLMFLSGVVKLMSGDESWRDLTAMTYHYWTQPLPNPLSPFMHALPEWLHRCAALVTFVIELICPFLIFWSRTRVWAAGAFILLSVSILLTGNYTFFNWLTIALCLWLIPDSLWMALADRLPFVLKTVEAPVYPGIATTGVMIALSLLTLIWCTRWFLPDGVTEPLRPVLQTVQRYAISNSYGLFAYMTKTRPEIVIEGSVDGKVWKEYEFKYKPGGLYRRPSWVAPHQPRLDWQMWFAALGSFQQSYWLQGLMARLFEQSPDVMAFFKWDPLEGQAPKYLRTKIYEYEFTSPSEILQNGMWWRRKSPQAFSPVFERP